MPVRHLGHDAEMQNSVDKGRTAPGKVKARSVGQRALIGPVAVVLLAGGAALVVPEPTKANAAQAEESAPDRLEVVAGPVRMVAGNRGEAFLGGNLGFCVGPEGVLAVDSFLGRTSEAVREVVESLGDQEVRMLVNTHWHGDHTGNNGLYRRAGGELIAHVNVRRRLAGDPEVEGRRVEGADVKPAALPSVTFEESLQLHLNGESIRLQHVGAGHTDGDALVWFETSKVVHMGDVFFKGRFPFIDLASGGSAVGMLSTVQTVLDATDEGWKIIPGHGTLASRGDLEAYAGMLQTAIERVRKGVEAGKGFEELREEGVLDDLDGTWGGGFIGKDQILNVLVQELS